MVYPMVGLFFCYNARMKATFKQRVLKIVTSIPKGKTLTYKQVAQMAGSPLSARAVGNILHNNDNPKVPCHRVIRSDGSLGGYNGINGKKHMLLKKEGAI